MMRKPLFKTGTPVQYYIINNKLVKCTTPVQSVPKCTETGTVYHTGNTVYRTGTPTGTPSALASVGIQAKCTETVPVHFGTPVHFQL